ncbi:DoxX family protein [Marinomonas mediterranea]|jgi:Predicted membrane protein|uniref:DoxX family protein n=1 Tax=Marinomonas mediterranea (strain ATCC 700492 / JCM 21426 / NBRC 103028 / MMB-1) TaxID=717774 RepID=F2JWA5_MARM1|nr:DoxX family protein [Marinomonas mediterranea]ADZ89493.1 DoxX family protein [Marinomonas mediterranea MMB-1]WCN07592.1 DoxX family membrane protein [Marinomonas mediterranea]WCN11691.1 DoxX family membrane protein [Marinomonas mediterranea]WCN15742.1 DoxX family membrane protein [Marinomonas mediterranea MMB-1]
MLEKINCLSTTLFEKIPESLVLFVARFSIAAVFWKSGQTKIEGFSLDIISMKFQLGMPRLAESTAFLFEYEYGLPLIPPAIAAVLATVAEHVLPVLILFGFFTRFAALGLAGMTLVIQTFVYPDAYPTHGTWLAICLLLMLRGAGSLSLDRVLFKK